MSASLLAIGNAMTFFGLSGFAKVLLGFVLGFALTRANSCTVANTRRLVIDHRPDWLFGLMIAISWAGVVLLGLAVWSPDKFHLPGALPLGWQLVAGSMLIGVGAMPDTIRLGFLVGFASIAPCSLDMLRRRRRSALVALVVVGVSGGFIYALNPDWSYLVIIDHAVNGRHENRQWIMEMGAVALLIGATISAMLRHRFAIVRLSATTAAPCLAGGFFMGIGGRLVPGGNDTLMLWSIPGLARYWVISYAIMLATIAAMLSAGRFRLRHFPLKAPA